MTRLKCSNCGNTFDRKTLSGNVFVGATGSRVGIGHSLLVWPFVLRVYAKCPVCKQTGWIRVLSPWTKA